MPCITCQPLQPARVKVELGPDQYAMVRSLMVGELNKLNADYPNKEQAKEWNLAVLNHCLVDDSGKQLFANLEQAKAFADSCHVATYVKLLNAAIEWSGLAPDDTAKKN